MHRYIRFLLITVSFFWGTSFAAAKIGLRELHPLNLVMLRFSLASAIFGVMLLLMGRGSKIEVRDIPTFLVMGFLGITSYFYIQFTGLQYTTTIHSALIIATSPLIVVLIGTVLKIERINKMMSIGVALAFTGVILIISEGKLTGLLNSNTLKGDLMLLSNATVWAGITLYGKKILTKYRPLVAMAYIHIFGTLLLLPLALIPDFFASQSLIEQFNHLSGATFAAALYLAVFCSVYGYFVWYMGVEKIGAVRTSVFAYCNPLFASLTGVLLLGEDITLLTICGGLMVMAGVYITNEFKPTVNEAKVAKI